MQANFEENPLFHSLHRMMDRLSPPDLTASESKLLALLQLEDLLDLISNAEQTMLAPGERSGSRNREIIRS